MRRLSIILGLWLALAATAQAQQNQPTVASGPLTPGHGLVLQQTGTPGAAVTRDAGPAIAGSFTEIGITNDGLPICVRDKAGQHLLCLGANALGGGLISYNPVGGGPPLGLNFNINGSTFAFPGPGNGNVVGPPSPVVHDVVLWNGGTTVSDSGIAVGQPLNALVTTQTVPFGSVGQGALYTNTVRTGGFGQYGNILNHYEVAAALPAPQFDVADTGWTTALNLTGGAVFGSWAGANTPAQYLGQPYSGGTAVGTEINYGNRWADFGLQLDVGGLRYTTGINLVPDVVPFTGPINAIALTSFTTGSPATFTLNSHGMYINMGVEFQGTAGITGLADLTTYYVISAGFGANTFEVAASIGGTAINTTGSPSGTLKAVPSWPGSFGLAQSHSVHGHQTYVEQLIRIDSIAPGGYGHIDEGSSVTTNEPQTWARVGGNWVDGLDLSNATFGTNIAIGLANGQLISVGGGLISGNAGALSLSTTGSGVTGALAGNSSAANALIWNVTGSTPALGFFGVTPVARQTVAGTLSAVTDANAKAVLTSIINALTALGLTINGTT